MYMYMYIYTYVYIYIYSRVIFLKKKHFQFYLNPNMYIDVSKFL